MAYNQGGSGNTGGSSGVSRGGSSGVGGASGPVSQNSMTTDLGGRLNIDIPGGDYIRTQQVVTKGYFTNDAGLLEGTNIHTGSLSKTNQNLLITQS